MSEDNRLERAREYAKGFTTREAWELYTMRPDAFVEALADYAESVEREVKKRLALAEAKLAEHDIAWEDGKGYVFSPKA